MSQIITFLAQYYISTNGTPTTFASRGVSANIADYDGRTPLYLAACENQIAVIQYFIEKKGINLKPKDCWGNTPLDDATKFKNKEIKELLEQTIKGQKKILSI